MEKNVTAFIQHFIDNSVFSVEEKISKCLVLFLQFGYYTLLTYKFNIITDKNFIDYEWEDCFKMFQLRKLKFYCYT